MRKRPLSPAPVQRGGAFAALTFSLLIGCASAAMAQTARPPADPLRDDLIAPPLSMSSPYNASSREGVYVLPGTMPGNDAPRRLPPLPKKEESKPPHRHAKPLPSPRRLFDPEKANPENHRAGTPAYLRYIRPSVRMRGTYPTPQPVREPQSLTIPQPLPDLQPQAPVRQTEPPVTVTPQVIPFGQPSAPMPQEPSVTVERAIPVEPQWQPPQPIAQPAPQPQDEVAEEFEAIISAPQETEIAPPAPIAEIPVIPPLNEDMAATAPTEPVIVAEPPKLSEESRKIIDATPSGIDTKRTTIRSPKPVIIKRTAPDAGLGPDVRTHEELGLKIEVRRADADVRSYLEEGYENLINGHESIAAGYYKEALKAEPENETALFGLATTYQRMGQRAEARELYGKLFAVNPTHREGLNNFMALISDEAPREAIEELEELETENPDFSPIPAQLGIVYNKLGNPQMAARKLARALNLSPENLSYKYNLAITLDKLGQVEAASDLYLELITAYNDGATLPGDVNDIRNRVIFINRER